MFLSEDVMGLPATSGQEATRGLINSWRPSKCFPSMWTMTASRMRTMGFAVHITAMETAPILPPTHVQPAVETALILPPEPHGDRSSSPCMSSAGPPAHLSPVLRIPSAELPIRLVHSPPPSSAMQPPRLLPPAGMETLSENTPGQRVLLHIKRYNGQLRATAITLRTSAENIAPAETTVIAPAETISPVESITLGPDTSADNGFTEIVETLTGSVRPELDNVVMMRETMTKHELSELEASNPWSKRLRTRK
ncbi:hypothetical protein JB92DRAFT_3098638 [Gautieria morchelliformis]|nr:hypothetical protein JB92DRAFT_3098638 [Gautieria morchelliformis]